MRGKRQRNPLCGGVSNYAAYLRVKRALKLQGGYQSSVDYCEMLAQYMAFKRGKYKEYMPDVDYAKGRRNPLSDTYAVTHANPSRRVGKKKLRKNHWLLPMAVGAGATLAVQRLAKRKNPASRTARLWFAQGVNQKGWSRWSASHEVNGHWLDIYGRGAGNYKVAIDGKVRGGTFSSLSGAKSFALREARK